MAEKTWWPLPDTLLKRYSPIKHRDFGYRPVSSAVVDLSCRMPSDIAHPVACKSAAKPVVGELTVYFDGGCPVCSREIAAYRRQTGAENCAWVDASSCPESALGSGLSSRDALARFHVRRADGELAVGMRAFALLWRELPRMAWAGRLASMGPMPALLEAAYRLFLAIRPLWRQAPRTAQRVVERHIS